eukprot:128435_1
MELVATRSFHCNLRCKLTDNYNKKLYLTMAQPNQSEGGLREKRLPRRAKEVQNKAPAPQQITAEQILREAHEMQFEKEAAPPRQQITDPEELRMYKLRNRRNFENNLRRNRMSIGVWLKYAAWEESQKEYERARSIFERIIDIDYRNHTIWLKYSEMEMRNRFINRARNVWDRAVALLPRVDQLWFKYALMEEKLSNFEGARRIFERWMKWNPPTKAWMAYIALEMRSVGNKSDKLYRCRLIYNRYINITNNKTEKSFIKYAQWEYKHSKSVIDTRKIYEMAINELDEEDLSVLFYKSFANFEILAKEYDRARVIYKYALDNIPKYKAYELYKEYMLFEKRYGNKENIDMVILQKKRMEYEQELVDNNKNYDLWFDYIRLEEQYINKNGNDISGYNQIREIYERAIAETPPIITDKRYWKRYIYLWIKYAIFEELITKDVNRARSIYNLCLKVIPHENFTFGKIWIMYAQFELRQGNLNKCREIFGEAIGKCAKKNIFNNYIAMEYQLGEFNRCRKIYEKLLELFPTDSKSWHDYGCLENKLDEYERAKSIYELGINQDILDEPQLLWSNYIDFELKRENYNNVRKLFERLLNKTKHVRVWINYAQFESQINKPINARNIFIKSNEYFKNIIKNNNMNICDDNNNNNNNLLELKESRTMLLEAWMQFESIWGNQNQQMKIYKLQPHKIKKRRPIKTVDGNDAGYEEYYDYRFPDDQKQKDSLNSLLERAKQWKMKQNK